MKIRKKAVISRLSTGNKNLSIPEDQEVELELSALDTGGGFKDPMLDFSLIMHSVPDILKGSEKKKEFTVRLYDPSNESRSCSFHLYAQCHITEGKAEINGRLKEDDLSKDIVHFVLRLPG